MLRPPRSSGRRFSILQADSAADLERMLERHPHLRLEGATIELSQFLELPGQG